MNWILAAGAPALIGGVFALSKSIHAAILSYHALCAVAVFRRRTEVRRLLSRDRMAPAWAAGATLVFLACAAAGPFLVDPRPWRDEVARVLFPFESPKLIFAGFAVYTMLVHAPLEEIFWRGVVMDPERGPAMRCIGGNAIFFYLVHAVPMGLALGNVGWLLAFPTAAAGAAWAFVALRTRSLWPGLVSHGAVDAAILYGMWRWIL